MICLAEDGGVGEEAIRAVEAMCAAFFGYLVDFARHDLGARRREALPGFRILTAGPGSRVGSWTYVTADCWGAVNDDGHGQEFMLSAPVRDESFAELLAMVAYYHVSQRLEHGDAQAEPLRRVLLVVMVTLLCPAAVNAVFITWATTLDNQRSSALARALGATPAETGAALAAAQALPALTGAITGAFPGGFTLFHAINAVTSGDSGRATLPSLWQLLTLVPATVLVVAALTAAPALLGGRRPVTGTLQAEPA